MILDKKVFRKSIVSLAIRTASAIAGGIFISLFLTREIKTASANLVKQKQFEYLLSNQASEIEILNFNNALMATGKNAIERALFKGDEIVEFLGSLETLAGSNALTQSVHFNAPQVSENPSISSVDYTININGNIFTLLQYLRDFEKLPYFTHVSAVNIKAGEFGWTGDSAITLSARLYIRK